jgi:hypothetical protein
MMGLTSANVIDVQAPKSSTSEDLTDARLPFGVHIARQHRPNEMDIIPHITNTGIIGANIPLMIKNSQNASE